MVDGASTMILFPYLLNVMFLYLLNVMGSGGLCQYYDIVSLPAGCDR